MPAKMEDTFFFCNDTRLISTKSIIIDHRLIETPPGPQEYIELIEGDMFFLSSEVIHSRDLFSYRIPISSTTTINETKHQHIIIILCHKDKTSFYKSTRKSNRTASRVWSGLFPTTDNANTSESSHEICDGYHVSTDSQQDTTAIHKRLTTEFGKYSTAIDVDIPNLSLTKYSSFGDTIERKRGVDVIFFELDTSTTNVDNDSTRDHFQMIQNVVSKLIKKQDRSAIIHLKCDTIHRAISTMSSKSKCISGVELEQYILDESKSSSNAPIRRLRDKKGASNCPLTLYPPRYVDKENKGVIEICRFHNYDAERGCLRMKRSKQNASVKECEMDHDHCHKCGGSHRAFECPDISLQYTNQSSVVFRRSTDGIIISEPFDKNKANNSATRETTSLPALLVLGGRMRGRTLATCEMLPLSTSTSNDKNQWLSLPNLQEHRGSHAACSAAGVVFVMGGGTSDGNSDTVEVLDFTNSTSSETEAKEWKWHTMASKLSSPRHAFGAVSCISRNQPSNDMTFVSLYAVGGWQYGSLSCESLERLTFEYQSDEKRGTLDMDWLYNQAEWELCAPLILPRRLHSVAASKDGISIYVFGGFIDERRTTSSIERYDIDTDTWSAVDKLPFENCPLVQAVAVGESSFFVFPYSTEQSTECYEAPLVMRYTPGSDDVLFSPISLPNGDELRLPITSWHSFTATLSTTLNRLYLIGGTIRKVRVCIVLSYEFVCSI